MPWLYAFHATGVVSLPHFNFLHSNFYLVLSHNHKCCGVSHATFIREKPTYPMVGMHSGRSAVGLSLSAENSHKARETMAASERGSAERNTTRTMLHASAEETDPPLSDAFLLRPCGDSITYSPRKGSMKDPSKTKNVA